MAQVLRFLFLIPAGFVLACSAASFALLWPFIDLPSTAAIDPFVWTELSIGFFAQTAQVGTLALLPWGIFMVLTEALGKRSILLHAAAGVAAGFMAAHIPPGAGNSAALETAMIVAGLAFGLVYWIVAGHGAGGWRRREAALPPPHP